MKTVHFFAFYPHNLLKITDFSPWTSMNLKNTKSLHFDGVDGSSLPRFQFSDVQSFLFRCAISLLQMFNQSSSDTQSVLFRCSISPLQISTSASLRFYS